MDVCLRMSNPTSSPLILELYLPLHSTSIHRGGHKAQTGSILWAMENSQGMGVRPMQRKLEFFLWHHYSGFCSFSFNSTSNPSNKFPFLLKFCHMQLKVLVLHFFYIFQLADQYVHWVLYRLLYSELQVIRYNDFPLVMQIVNDHREKVYHLLDYMVQHNLGERHKNNGNNDVGKKINAKHNFKEEYTSYGSIFWLEESELKESKYKVWFCRCLSQFSVVMDLSEFCFSFLIAWLNYLPPIFSFLSSE